jgi:citrate lyase subunit beta/citryl-CoA lyase
MVKAFDPPLAPLFVPGSRPERFAKAAAAATTIILDLEDAVAPAAKAEARTHVAEHSAKLPIPVIVRINGCRTPWFAADMAAIRLTPIAAVMLPKTESAADVALVIAAAERPIPVIGLIESARGLDRLSEILVAPDFAFAAFGSIDFALDICCAHDRIALLAARTELVWRSRAAAKPAPIDGVTARVDSPLLALRDARHSANLGFSGKMAVHPIQVEPIARAFRPDKRAITWAEKVAKIASDGTATSLDGEMVDGPVVERARSILRRASIL